MTTHFSPEELALALSEDINLGLINAFSLQCAPAGQVADDARATVTLLEGQDVEIRLTPKGFEVLTPASSSPPSSATEPTMHETLPNLLGSISPMYAKKWDEALFSRLQQVQDAQAADE